jgi:hypothetical protein
MYYFVVPYEQPPKEMEENHEKPVRITGNLAENRTACLPNTC